MVYVLMYPHAVSRLACDGLSESMESWFNNLRYLYAMSRLAWDDQYTNGKASVT